LLPQTDHGYKWGFQNLCTPAQSASILSAPGVSAPGAPAAVPGPPTQNIQLSPVSDIFPPWSWIQNNLPADFVHTNPITQVVTTSPVFQITNVTQPGHIFGGQVVTAVTPSGPFSYVNSQGSGNGNWPILNNILGSLFFGGRNLAMALVCGSKGAGDPNGAPPHTPL